MENREKFEIPTLEFTPVTLMNAAGSGPKCKAEGCNEVTGTEVDWGTGQGN